MTQRTITCPYCASQITGESTVCPGCQEDLAALAHLVYADAIHYNQALALAKEGRPREAKAELAESLAANASFGPAYALLAKMCARDQDWANARLNAKKALSLLPDDVAIVRLADEVITTAPPIVLTPYTEPVDIPQNPALLDQSRSEAKDSSIIDTGPVSALIGIPEDVRDNDAAFEAVQPIPPVTIPARPNNSRKRDAQGRRIPQVGLTTGPSSYLFPPQELTSPVVDLLVEPTIEPVIDPEVQPSLESGSIPTEDASQAEESYGPLFKGSIWRTLGMGILITAGLAILIRAMSGED